ncbi:uncharacterized protein EV154DRAFT_505770 [Mucor mucedo]|uniref:uncharacterized protein n=1 Tax=Mucor mucedo TaxID=29922 RepID=UPI00221EE07F|nr:uncharacterized protein EV154DRAFT_505770 [Mucor mucedo]KAI7892145.1 hypothetical protein EV154DRAFT_505770 [Mucor mucedo]
MPREGKKVAIQSKKSNIFYENWKVYSTGHKLMFRCNQKKADWYLKRDLAVLLPKESRSIKLTFEAKGDGHKKGDYMVEDRNNMCVACGSTKDLSIHHVVPEMYRQWMPLVIKAKSSRDLLLLCQHCRLSYEPSAMDFKKRCVREFNIPLEGRGWVSLPHYKVAKKAASALKMHSNVIPADRQVTLKTTVFDFWEKHGSEVDEELAAKDTEENWDSILEVCSTLVDHFKGPDYIEHANSAIEQLTKTVELDSEGRETWPDLEDFIKDWRRHFLRNLDPEFLSELWTVDGDIYTR